jgi:hypothetical protein
VQGIVFMEIVKITDLPPERNGMSRRKPNRPQTCVDPKQ